MQIPGLLEEISISGALGAPPPPPRVEQDVLYTPLLAWLLRHVLGRNRAFLQPHAFVLWMQKLSSRQMKMGLGG